MSCVSWGRCSPGPPSPKGKPPRSTVWAASAWRGAGGCRPTSTFYESFYALPDYRGLTRAPASPGGPFLGVSFGYSVTEYFELGVDLFTTGEQLRLTNAPTLTNVSYGALVALRFQTLFDVLTPEGVVPFIGLETGPTLAYSQADGVGKRELATQTFAGSVGASFRFTPRWALTAEYRIAFARGQTAFQNRDEFKSVLASYNAGGNWFALGLTYYLPSTGTSHPLP